MKKNCEDRQIYLPWYIIGQNQSNNALDEIIIMRYNNNKSTWGKWPKIFPLPLLRNKTEILCNFLICICIISSPIKTFMTYMYMEKIEHNNFLTVFFFNSVTTIIIDKTSLFSVSIHRCLQGKIQIKV